MPKPRTSFICNECGAESPQWFGKCPSCNTYNSLEEQLITQSAALPSRGNWPGGSRSNGKVAAHDEPKPRLSLKFSEITERQEARWSSGYEEFNRVLGGGVVPGSLVLIGGDPGIGKSTCGTTTHSLCFWGRVRTTSKVESFSFGSW